MMQILDEDGKKERIRREAKIGYRGEKEGLHVRQEGLAQGLAQGRMCQTNSGLMTSCALKKEKSVQIRLAYTSSRV